LKTTAESEEEKIFTHLVEERGRGISKTIMYTGRLGISGSITAETV
jgi:hypothetical protein